jgi:glycosyltransferase involved in cell wall biosynthesis
MADPDTGSVLVVHHRDLSTPIGTTVAYYVADRLSETHTVHVVCRKRGKERSGDHDQRATLHQIDAGEMPVVSAIAFHALATLYVVLLGLRYRYDAVYSFQSSVVQGQVGAWAAGARFVVDLASVPVRQREDFSEHTGSRPDRRERLAAWLMSLYAVVVGRLLDRSSAVICLTEGIREVTEATYDLDLADAHVLGMGVDVATFADAGDDDVDGNGNDGESATVDEDVRPTLTYIGAINESRELDEVVEALAELDRQATLQFAGQGPDEYERRLLDRAEERGVVDRVDWLGLVPHRKVPLLLSRADVALSPLPDIESYRVSFPAKLLEYMAAGTRVVATDIRPHRLLIDDGDNGYLYDGSRAGLVDAVERALDDDRDAVVQRARDTARAYDWDVLVGAYEAAIFGAEPTSPDAATDPRERHRGATRS